jgi:hypothetical protein
MILDPHDWDNIPQPLVDTQVLTTPTIAKKKSASVEEMPWD